MEIVSKLVIEKGVPVPPRKYRTRVYPFSDMEVGDSFKLDDRKKSVECAASYYGRRNGKKFACRKDGDGVRVWRIA